MSKVIENHLPKNGAQEIQRINLNDYIQTGEGGAALSYTS